MKYTIGFIGCGNMGGALITATGKVLNGKEIAVCDHNIEKLKKFESLKVNIVNAIELAKNSNFVVLGVKPQAMENTILEIKNELKSNPNLVVITMAAGLTINAINKYLGFDCPIIRIMPNTPCLLGEGMIVYSTYNLSIEREKEFLLLFSQAGILDKIEESKIDAASAISGCGPAFCYAFASALLEGGIECGLDEDKASLYAFQTILGASKMLLKFNNPNDLIKAVCSPNGTTIEGIKFLKNNDFNKIAKGAVKSSYNRTLELKK